MWWPQLLYLLATSSFSILNFRGYQNFSLYNRISIFRRFHASSYVHTYASNDLLSERLPSLYCTDPLAFHKPMEAVAAAHDASSQCGWDLIVELCHEIFPMDLLNNLPTRNSIGVTDDNQSHSFHYIYQGELFLISLLHLSKISLSQPSQPSQPSQLSHLTLLHKIFFTSLISESSISSSYFNNSKTPCTAIPSLANNHTTNKVIMVQFTVFKGSKEGKIVESTTTKDLGADEVLIKVTHSGLCGTDEHYKGVDMVLGHEGAGVVEVSSNLPYSKPSSNRNQGNRCISQDLPQG